MRYVKQFAPCRVHIGRASQKITTETTIVLLSINDFFETSWNGISRPQMIASASQENFGSSLNGFDEDIWSKNKIVYIVYIKYIIYTTYTLFESSTYIIIIYTRYLA
jgi:hypothetical protein